jgi:NADPH-dependent curcumin reductase CurA
VDPANRAWMQGKTYRGQLLPGDLIPGFAIGEVLESTVSGLNRGDIVEGALGWQDYAVVTSADVIVRDRALPLEHLAGVLGITGLSAYFGMLEVARIRPADTVVVSAAGGAVGSIAAQVAKISGCRVVGVAGGAEKCQWLTDELGLDAAVDYKAGNVFHDLKAVCLAGIDAYFDNTGGDILAAALALMNTHGRIACCGNVSEYDLDQARAGPRGVPGLLVVKRVRMEGFLVSDYFHLRSSAEKVLREWLATGQLKAPVHLVEGFDKTPRALIDLLAGVNRGKVMVRI